MSETLGEYKTVYKLQDDDGRREAVCVLLLLLQASSLLIFTCQSVKQMKKFNGLELKGPQPSRVRIFLFIIVVGLF